MEEDKIYKIYKKRFVPRDKIEYAYRLTIDAKEPFFAENNLPHDFLYGDSILIRENSLPEIKSFIISHYKNKTYADLLHDGQNRRISFIIYTDNDSDIEDSSVQMIAISTLEELKNIICKTLDSVDRYKKRALKLAEDYK